ncbi:MULTISPECIES: HAD-IIA family hydrolase [Desulfosporosinus]|uniref:Acid sugar phosphatase n=1 Tax=Desulfosporosinus acididurans TaxID=476652 RepID=A0A0J1FU62_9FIRM|nr:MULTISPECIES: HAD-IIA family hydrolase [Desulfosporosinus]KLU66994.1 arabinose operon protein AraL [Desulfosporosinus acididurans]
MLNDDLSGYAFIFDLDGTLYIGDEIIEGAPSALEWIRSKDAKVRFLTNNPRFSVEYYVKKLKGLGIYALPEEVITSAVITANYLKKRKQKYGRLYVIGEQELIEQLTKAGIAISADSSAETVLVSFDTTLNYEKLLNGHRALKKGAAFIATNPDPVCPYRNDGLPDAGAIIAAFEATTGRKVEMIFGKPSKDLALQIIEDLGITRDHCIVIGDRLTTDIQFGSEGGMKTIWVNPGFKESKTVIPANGVQPDFTINSVRELPKVCNEIIE